MALSVDNVPPLSIKSDRKPNETKKRQHTGGENLKKSVY